MILKAAQDLFTPIAYLTRIFLGERGYSIFRFLPYSISFCCP